MVKMDPPKLVPPGTYFTAKYGLPLKNLDHLTQMKKTDPEHIWTSGLFRRVSEVLETIQTRKFSTIVQASFPAEPHATFDTVYIEQLFL